jgi:hypothetical protein
MAGEGPPDAAVAPRLQPWKRALRVQALPQPWQSPLPLPVPQHQPQTHEQAGSLGVDLCASSLPSSAQGASSGPLTLWLLPAALGRRLGCRLGGAVVVAFDGPAGLRPGPAAAPDAFGSVRIGSAALQLCEQRSCRRRQGGSLGRLCSAGQQRWVRMLFSPHATRATRAANLGSKMLFRRKMLNRMRVAPHAHSIRLRHRHRHRRRHRHTW